MKMTLYSYSLLLKKTKDLGKTSLVPRNGLLISINGNWGEIAPLEGFSKESYSEALQQTMDVCNALAKGEKAQNELYPSVDFGFSSALFPLREKGSLAICALGLDKKPLSNFTKIKLYSYTIDQSISIVQKIKKVYPNLKLRLDINRKWSLDQALYFTEHFSKKDFDYLEEPCESLEDLQTFSQKTLFPIGLDETLYLNENIPYEMIPSLRALILKPTMIGGLFSLSSFIDIAEKRDLDVILSSSFESGVGIQNICYLASLLNLKKPQGLDTLRYFKEDLLEDTLALDQKEGIILIDSEFKEPDRKNITKIGTWKSKKNSSALYVPLNNFLVKKQRFSTTI